jgi:membrane protease YdiL (CAAX protease family)
LTFKILSLILHYLFTLDGYAGFTSLIGLIIFPALYIKFVEHKPLAPFFNSEKDFLKLMVIIAGVGLCFLVAISPVVEWNMNFQFPEFLKEFGSWARTQEDKLIEMTKFLTTFNTPYEFLLGLFVIAILPGIGEELVFRGSFKTNFGEAVKTFMPRFGLPLFSLVLFTCSSLDLCRACYWVPCLDTSIIGLVIY